MLRNKSFFKMSLVLKSFSIFLIIISLFSGCGKKEEEKKQISFIFWASPEQLKIFEKIMDSFHKTYPEIKVKLFYVGPGYEEKLATMIAGGTCPDVVAVSEWHWLGYIGTTLLSGVKPDRPPLFDLVCNDAIIEHFSGEKLTFDNAEELIYGMFHKVIDGTRPGILIPSEDKVEIWEDGRKYYRQRWTGWLEHKKYSSSEEYREVKKLQLSNSWDWNVADEKGLSVFIAEHQKMQERLGGDIFLVWISPANVSLMDIYGEVGIEHFSYYLTDCYEIIIEQLEYNTVKSLQKIEHLPDSLKIPCVFIGDDIAFKTSTILSPAFFQREYFPRFRKIIDALHKRGIKIMFHSDGNLMTILDGFVESGIDLLNPIEITAGMDVKEIHRRYPHLIMAGGIDVSNLLPFGKPEEIKEVVLRAIEDSEGKIMVGSSTELHNIVPFENFLAMRETVLNYKY